MLMKVKYTILFLLLCYLVTNVKTPFFREYNHEFMFVRSGFGTVTDLVLNAVPGFLTISDPMIGLLNTNI